MKLDEFAFFNQQLGAMLERGIPLEGAIRRLCESMRDADLRAEFERLEADLQTGTPLDAALDRRRLPPLYVHMVKAGARSGTLPSLLILVADYYRAAHDAWTRLTGLMVYPVIVLTLALAVTVSFVVFFATTLAPLLRDMLSLDPHQHVNRMSVSLLAPPVAVAVALAGIVTGLAVPSLRQRLRWRLPAFREASVAQLAGAMAIMLRGGCTLSEAVEVLAGLESGSPAGRDLALWRQRIAEGRSNFASVAEGSRTVPALLVWLVDSAGEDIAEGFAAAAEIYRERAARRTEVLLYGALPVSVLVLGAMLASQGASLVRWFTEFVRLMG